MVEQRTNVKHERNKHRKEVKTLMRDFKSMRPPHCYCIYMHLILAERTLNIVVVKCYAENEAIKEKTNYFGF